METLLVKSKFDLYRLRQGTRVWKDENIEPAIGQRFLIRSPFSKTDYLSKIHDYTDFAILDKYIYAGNCFKIIDNA